MTGAVFLLLALALLCGGTDIGALLAILLFVFIFA